MESWFEELKDYADNGTMAPWLRSVLVLAIQEILHLRKDLGELRTEAEKLRAENHELKERSWMKTSKSPGN